MSRDNRMDYVEACLIAWAEWNRYGRENLGYASRSTIHRIMVEGPGASQATALLDMPDYISKTDHAIRALPERECEAIKLKYLRTNLTDQQRAEKMDVSRATYQSTVDRAKWFIRGRVG